MIADSNYPEVASSRLYWSVVNPRIFRMLMKGNFDAYVLWPLDKMVQNWRVDRSTALYGIIISSVMESSQWCFKVFGQSLINVLGSIWVDFLMCQSWNFEYYIYLLLFFVMFTFYWQNKFLSGQSFLFFWVIKLTNIQDSEFQLWQISRSTHVIHRTKDNAEPKN